MLKRLVMLTFFLALPSSVLAQAPKAPVFKTPVVEVFGGYSYTRFSATGPSMNGNGVLGSFAWNFKPWVQVVADASYDRASAAGAPTNLYGNHYGFRFFYRSPRKWGLSPFGEVLSGGSKVDMKVGASHFSDLGFSLKTGGGLDLGVYRRVTIRLFDADYYRTSFFHARQSDVWLSGGIVLRFGGL
jgi:hypothetical protein